MQQAHYSMSKIFRQESLNIVFIFVILFFVSCGGMHKVNKYNAQGYTFIINETDTLVFDKIYLDNGHNHSFKIDRSLKTINYYPGTDSLTQLLAFNQIEEHYKDSAKQIAFIIFHSDFIGPETKYYLQRSLLENPERIKDEVMARIRCYGRQGDVLIFE